MMSGQLTVIASKDNSNKQCSDKTLFIKIGDQLDLAGAIASASSMVFCLFIHLDKFVDCLPHSMNSSRFWGSRWSHSILTTTM